MRLFIIIIYIYIIIQARINCHLNTRQEEKEEGRREGGRTRIGEKLRGGRRETGWDRGILRKEVERAIWDEM